MTDDSGVAEARTDTADPVEVLKALRDVALRTAWTPLGASSVPMVSAPRIVLQSAADLVEHLTAELAETERRRANLAHDWQQDSANADRVIAELRAGRDTAAAQALARVLALANEAIEKANNWPSDYDGCIRASDVRRAAALSGGQE